MRSGERSRANQDGAPEISPETGRPEWAGRVSRSKVVQLYRTDAQGIIDKDLIDEVGYTLLTRCESILLATEAGRGRAMCPVCRSTIYHGSGSEEILECASCGWQLAWSEYYASIRRKQLGAGGIEPFLKEFVQQFPKAPSPRHRMILIDQLIHRYHWEMIQDPGRPGCNSLIGGTVGQVMSMLNSLSYSDASTPGLREVHNRWRKKGKRVLRRLEKSGVLDSGATEDSDA